MKITSQNLWVAGQILLKLISTFFRVLSFLFRLLFTGLTPKKTNYEGTFNTPSALLSRWNKGFAFGSFKATKHDSCLHSIVLGGSGSGKSVSVLLPTIYNSTDASLCIHNPSTELRQSAGYLKKQGYDIKILHYGNPDISEGFNPLQRAEGAEIQKLCTLLVKASLGDGGKDPFWSTQAILFLVLLCNIVKTQEEQYQNFTNIKYLVEQYQINPESMDRLVVKTGSEEILNEYKVFLKYESKVMANIVSTCRSALTIFNDPSVQKITSIDTIDFSEFRAKKVALFIENSTSNMHYYGVLTSMFAQLFFNYIMDQPPNIKKQRPIYFLLDEASSLFLPNTLQLALSNLRKFACGIMLLLQDFNQLKHLYGNHESEAIKTNSYIKVFFTNQDIDTCRELETFLGKREYVDEEGKKKIRPVLTADEIKTMPKGHALVFVGSNRAIYMRMRPYFKSVRLWLYSRLPAPIPKQKLPEGKVPLLPLPKPLPKKATTKAKPNNTPPKTKRDEKGEK